MVQVTIRNELARLSLDTEQKLAEHLGIPIDNLPVMHRELHATIRRKYLFQGDQNCHKKAKKISDGFEHGFSEFDEIRPLAIDVRDKTASYLRTAIIKFLGLPSQIEQDLLSKPYESPIDIEGYVRYLRGKLLSSSDELAQDGSPYPIVDWRFSVASFKVTDDNKLQLSFSQQLTPRIGENVSFQPNRLEIFGPEGVINTNPKEHKLEPTITSKDRELKDMSSDELRTILSEALQDGRFEELRIRTKKNELLIIKNESDLKKK